MVAPDTVLSSIKEAIKSSGRLPSATSYAIFELDFDGGQSDVYPPVVEITTVDTIRSTSMNTDYAGIVLDADENEVGKIYEPAFEMPVQINIITAEGDGYDSRELLREIRLALYQYEDRNRGTALPDPDADGTLSEISRFQIGDGEPNVDVGMTPALRGFQQQVTVWFVDRIDSVAEYGAREYVDEVFIPTPNSASGGDDFEIVLDGTPNEDSPGDDY